MFLGATFWEAHVLDEGLYIVREETIRSIDLTQVARETTGARTLSVKWIALKALEGSF